MSSSPEKTREEHVRIDSSDAGQGRESTMSLGTGSAGSRVRRWLERYATIIGFAAVFGVFSVLRPSIFDTWSNITNILDQTAPILILAIGLTVVISAGEFDLAFPALVGVCAVVSVKVMGSDGAGVLVAVLVALGVGVIGGVVAGVLVAAKRASSFITTLALSSIWTGLALGLSGGGGSTLTTVAPDWPNLSTDSVLGLKFPVLYAIGVMIVGWVLLRQTVFGRNARAIGDNEVAARLSGIRLSLTRVGVFVFMGICVGIAAIILSSETGEYSPDIATGIFIPPFLAAYFGLSVLARGEFNIFGTVVGALFVGMLETGLLIENVQSWVTDLIVGAALLITLFVATQRRR
jgi:ribose/xylose/arabinose/galactoside ABC-type transport system permease subunit